MALAAALALLACGAALAAAEEPGSGVLSQALASAKESTSITIFWRTSVTFHLGNDLVHDLPRAAADRVKARVAVQPLDHVLAHVAVAAVDLDRLVAHERAGVRGGIFCHRGQARHLLAAQVPLQSLVLEGA